MRRQRINLKRSVRHGVVGLVRVIDGTTSPGVGLEIDICRVTPDGAHHLTDEEIAAAREDVDHWRRLEAEALDELFPGDD